MYIEVLGPALFGVYGLALSASAFLSILTSATASVYLHFYWRAKRSDRAGAVGELNSLLLLICGIGLLALVALSGWLMASDLEFFAGGLEASESQLAKELMALLSVNVGLSLVFSLFESILLADERFVILRFLGIGRQVIAPLASIPLVYIFENVLTLALLVIGVNILMGICGLVAAFALVRTEFRRIRVEAGQLPDILRFAGFVLFGTVIAQVNWNIDRLFIAEYHGAVDVGVLTVVLQLNTWFMLLSTMISNVFAPLVNEYASRAGQDASIGNLFVRVGRYQAFLLGVVFAVFVVVGSDFIGLWVGQEYKDGYPAALIYMTGGFLAFTQSLGLDIQRAYNQHRFRTFVLSVGAVFKVLLSFWLVKEYGVIGAAVGTAVTLLLFNFGAISVHYSLVNRLPVLRLFRNVIQIFVLILIAIGAGLVVGVFLVPTHILVSLICRALVTGVVFVVLWWFFVAHGVERQRILNVVRSRR